MSHRAASFRKRPKTHGHDDMVMLSKSDDRHIHDNLETRYRNDVIYTYIGEVLIAVNPFKNLVGFYDDKKIEEYQGVQMSENPPHIFAVGDDMYRNMMIDKENQCVIISGESGAGKTVNAKFIMEYLSKVSGGVGDIERVKQIILSTNPLLEAFGNAKTIRNNNSSRFGKYFNINFDHGGQPVGGDIANFLLEKSRVSGIQAGERNFHIFYMMMAGLKANNMAEQYGLQGGPSTFHYTSMSGEYQAEGIDDLKEFYDMENALKTINISDEQITTIYKILSAILFLGNIHFEEDASGVAQIADFESTIGNAAAFLNVDAGYLANAITTCKVRIRGEEIHKTFNPVQARTARDSLVQGIYTRMFDFFVAQINRALQSKAAQTLNIGVLDIYGFEIFDNNGFEQLCINFVNEKLQQIFIELTLKSEQEEYRKEQIRWTDIKFFNNEEICNIIEGKIPQVGIFMRIDDVGKQANAMDPEKVDRQICNNIHGLAKTDNRNIVKPGAATSFLIQHYAGTVTYNCSGFFEKNRDTLYEDMVLSMKSSGLPFLAALFDNERDNVIANPQAQQPGRKKGVVSAGMTIKKQSNHLVDELKRSRPHYVRCIKPNETKHPGDWESVRVTHQVKYLGLSENVRVRRAGFAYRRPFDKFIGRYNILQYMDDPTRAQPPTPYGNNPQAGKASIQRIMDNCGMSPDEWQFGKTKLFIKSPESVMILEDKRELLYDRFARSVQKHLRNWLNIQKAAEIREDSSRVVFNKKDRSRHSISRRFFGDYIGLEQHPEYRQFCKKRETVLFAAHVQKYDGKMNPIKRSLLLTTRRLQVLGWEQVPMPKGSNHPPQFQLGLKFDQELANLKEVYATSLQDGFVLIRDTWSAEKDPARADLMLSTEYLTEFLYLLTTKTQSKNLNVMFKNDWVVLTPRPKGFFGKFKKLPRMLSFKTNPSPQGGTVQIKKTAKHKFEIYVAQGLPNNSGNAPSNVKMRGGPTGHSVQVDRNSRQIGLSVHGYGGNQASNAHQAGHQQSQPTYDIPYRQTSINGNSGQVGRLKSVVNRGGMQGVQIKQSTYRPPSQQEVDSRARTQMANDQLSQAMAGLHSQIGGLGMYGSPDGVNRAKSRGFGVNAQVQNPHSVEHDTSHEARGGGVSGMPSGGVAMFGGMMTGGVGHGAPPPKPKIRPKPTVLKCRALYDYDAADYDELSLRTDDVVQILEENEGGWWRGRLNGKDGLFPGNYVEKI